MSPLDLRLSPAAVQCDVMKPEIPAETPSTQRHAHEAGPQAHTSSQHPGMVVPSEHWKTLAQSHAAQL